MRATMRIMRWMLSLSFLFHSAFPSASLTTTQTPSNESTSVKTSTELQGSAAVNTTADPHVSSQTRPQAFKNNASSSSSNTSMSSSHPPVSSPTASLSPLKTTIPTATATMVTPSATATTSAPTAIPTTATKSASVTTPTTAGSGSTPGGFLSTTKTQSPVTSILSTNSTTEPLVTPKPNRSPAERSKITKVSTHPTPGQTHSAVTKMSEREKTTSLVLRNGQIKLSTTETGKRDTITHPTPTTTDSHVLRSQSGTTFLQTSTAVTTDPQPNIFVYSLNSRPENDKDKELAELCKRLMANLQTGNCTLVRSHKNGKVQFDLGEINGKVKTSLISQYYEEISKKPPDNKTLIAILASCGALLIMIFILAICASHHRRSFSENQQHLTEELHTVENGYHDNPTLDVMEVQPEMQEKKMVLNGEFSNDSWIVPIDNLLKEDILDEEDTHL